MKQIIMTILGLLIVSSPIAILAENKVEYSPEMEDYIGIWTCETPHVEGQWVPLRIEIKKKGKNLKWTFYRNSGKAPDDFYIGPVWCDGGFEFSNSPNYYDIRPSHRNKFKYSFRSRLIEYDSYQMHPNKLYFTLQIWYYNELGEIDSQDFDVCYLRDDQ